MFSKKSQEQKILKLTCYKNGLLEQSFELNKKKLLIGSSEKADIRLNDDHISSYHAFIILDGHGDGKVIDLDSENGVSINGKKIDTSTFSSGDIIKFGPVEFRIDDIMEVQNKGEQLIKNIDDSVKIINTTELTKTSPQLPPMPGLSIIDGEYCNILFDEDDFIPTHKIEAITHKYDRSNYVDFEEETPDLEITPITKEINGESIEITILSMGSIISVDYFKIKNATYYRSAVAHRKNTVLIHNTEGDESHPFIQIKNDQIKILKMDQFVASNLTSSTQNIFSEDDSYFMESSDIISFNYMSVQVMLRIVETPPALKKTPFFGKDSEFKIQTAKVVSAIMGVMLLLLLVDITPPEPPKKKLAIIYKKAVKAITKSNQKSSTKPNKIDKDTGVKKKETPKKEVKMAKTAAPTKSKLKKTKDKKMKPVKKITKKAPTPKAKKVVKMKAYKFKMKKTLSGLMGSKKSFKNIKVASSKKHTSKAGFKASSNSKSNLNYKSSSAVATFGSDLQGSYDKSTGTRGLASKSGIDTTYMDPKTVVLGSMDPELLRKILREYLPQFRHCYQVELEEHSESVRGVVDLNFRIGKSGKVTKTGIRSKKSKFSKKGVNCMTRVLKLIKFPIPKGGGVVDVKQPLNFSSSKTKI